MTWLTVLIAAPLVYLGAILLIWVASPTPTLGVQADGKLVPCPASPNCVSSQAADAEHRVEPFPITGDPKDVMTRLRNVFEAQPRTRVLQATDTYLRGECVTLFMRYTDDLEFLLDPGRQVIDVRSASRIGHSDLGANRARVEALRAAWKSAGE